MSPPCPVRSFRPEPAGTPRELPCGRTTPVRGTRTRRVRQQVRVVRRRTAPARECIDRIATPMSTVVMPCRAAVIGPMVVPHGIELLETKVCHGTPARSQAAAKTARPAAVRGVALVDVDLEDRAAVGPRVVRRVVPLRVVGVHGVPGVGGQADGARRRRAPGPRTSRRARRPSAPAPCRAAGRRRRCRTGCRSPRGRRRRAPGCTGSSRRRRAATAASAAVPACTDSRLSMRGPAISSLVAAQVGGRLDAVRHQVPADDVGRRPARPPRRRRRSGRPRSAVAEAPDRLSCGAACRASGPRR